MNGFVEHVLINRHAHHSSSRAGKQFLKIKIKIKQRKISSTYDNILVNPRRRQDL